MFNRAPLILAAASLAFAGACRAETLHFAAPLSGSAEVPANTESGQGRVTADLDTTTKVLTYKAVYSGATGPGLMAHFHGPAAPGTNTPPVVPATSGSSPITGTATLTDAQVEDLKAGRWYFNVHTAAHKGGELRGQLTPAP